MWRFPPIFGLLLLCLAALTDAQGSSNTSSLWKTLDGKAPLVVARGGFSGVFPDSSANAYQLAGIYGLPNVNYWCDVQLTKDGAGICFPDLTLQNGTDIEFGFKNRETTHIVNGQSVQGWFSVDFTLNELLNTIFTQETLSRSPYFDGTQGSVLTVQQVDKLRKKGQGLWLNVQHDAFFSQNKLSMRNFTLSVMRTTVVDYISSPEVSFLRSIVDRKPPTTKLVFRFLAQGDFEPSTNQTYDTLLENLTFIKTFASGILVPKGYIWPVDTDQYLLPTSTTLVTDAHSAGLLVFAADFANDITFPYNYSYDPLAEYLKFIDNGEFSVDGVVSDFPVTPSSAIDCFAHIGENDPGQDTPLIISFGGSSGDYPSSTDLAYDKAINDGADIIDCMVQMTKDEVPICLTNIDLAAVTTSTMNNSPISIPELKIVNGIPTFNVTWTDIQKFLRPFLVSPYQASSLFRNPRERNSGKFTSLPDFLSRAESSQTLSGVLIIIENAIYLAEQENLDVIGVVLRTLANSSYAKTTKTVKIQSTSSSVLKKIKENNSSYELVYRIDEIISTADNTSLTEIKEFATAVVIGKSTVFPTEAVYIKKMTDVVKEMHAFNLKVYVQFFRNEYLSQAWDFLSDGTFEINSFMLAGGIDGIVADYPATAARYRKNRCLKMNEKPPYMKAADPGSLLRLTSPSQLPPAAAPSPGLTESDVEEPPIPSVTPTTTVPGNTSHQSPSPSPPPPSGQPKMVAGSILISWTAIFLAVMSMF